MMDHPEILERAQRELDAVAPGRLPDFDDEDSLPFVTAIVLESLRYMPVAPVVDHLIAWRKTNRNIIFTVDRALLLEQWT